MRVLDAPDPVGCQEPVLTMPTTAPVVLPSQDGRQTLKKISVNARTTELTNTPTQADLTVCADDGDGGKHNSSDGATIMGDAAILLDDTIAAQLELELCEMQEKQNIQQRKRRGQRNRKPTQKMQDEQDEEVLTMPTTAPVVLPSQEEIHNLKKINVNEQLEQQQELCEQRPTKVKVVFNQPPPNVKFISTETRRSSRKRTQPQTFDSDRKSDSAAVSTSRSPKQVSPSAKQLKQTSPSAKQTAAEKVATRKLAQALVGSVRVAKSAANAAAKAERAAGRSAWGAGSRAIGAKEGSFLYEVIHKKGIRVRERLALESPQLGDKVRHIRSRSSSCNA
jgi:hypothetical protein